MHNESMCAERVLLVAGDFDLVSVPNDIEELHPNGAARNCCGFAKGISVTGCFGKPWRRIRERWL